MKIYGVVYLIWNMLNGKKYVGQTTKTVEERFRQHKRCKKGLIGKAIRKYGKEKFRYGVIVSCMSKAEMDEKEKFFIIALRSKNPFGYNQTDGGDGAVGYTPTTEHRANISASLTGRHLSPEHRKNISASKSGENNPNYGKHRSEQTKAKLRLSKIGEKNPQYGKPAPNRGKKHTEATKAKMRGKRHCNFGKPSSRRGKSLFPNLIFEINAQGLLYPVLANLLGMSLSAFSMKMRGQRNFTEENKENLVKILGKPMEYLFAGD